MRTSDFAIQRDKRYRDTLIWDTWRQKIRRTAHQFAYLYERLFWHPNWRNQSRQQNSPPRLSVCLVTMNSADRIAPLLEYIRPFAHEIVVGVDSKTTDNTLAVCQKLADVAFVIESNAQTCNAILEPVIASCQGDWILRLDDDEFPEPHLAQLINGVISQTKYTHFKVPRLHLCNAAPLQWINDGYLYPDYQLRLFRNDPSLLTFPGAVGHRGIECAGPKGRLNGVNLVHLNLAINPRFKREQKLETYIERLNGEWVHPVNEHALLWEDFNYTIQPYRYPDPVFCNLLTETVLTQQALYNAQKPSVKI